MPLEELHSSVLWYPSPTFSVSPDLSALPNFFLKRRTFVLPSMSMQSDCKFHDEVRNVVLVFLCLVCSS